jgi:hypothetical protein
MGRRATVNKIAAPVVFLASPAATCVIGPILAVDGRYPDVSRSPFAEPGQRSRRVAPVPREQVGATSALLP